MLLSPQNVSQSIVQLKARGADLRLSSAVIFIFPAFLSFISITLNICIHIDLPHICAPPIGETAAATWHSGNEKIGGRESASNFRVQ